MKKSLDYTRLLPRALRAIRCANVRYGILSPQSSLRRDDEQMRACQRVKNFNRKSATPRYGGRINTMLLKRAW